MSLALLTRLAGIRLSHQGTRCFSESKYPVITDSFLQKYDHFKALSAPDKMRRLIDRSLDLLTNQAHTKKSITEKWKDLQRQHAHDEEPIADYNPNNLPQSLALIVRRIPIPIYHNNIQSITSKGWASNPRFSLPLESLTEEQIVIGLTLAKYVKERTALIGAATWGGNETFHFLYSLGEYARERSFIHFVANIEVNPLNARLAYVVARELNLPSQRFQSIEGDALFALPNIPSEIEACHQAIIACRFIPTLTFYEMTAFIIQIRQSLSVTKGYAILTCSVLSLDHWEKLENESIKMIKYACAVGMLRPEKIVGKDDSLLGISLIENINDPSRNLVKERVFQTLLFKERVPQFFAEQKLKVVERKSVGIVENYEREAIVLIED